MSEHEAGQLPGKPASSHFSDGWRIEASGFRSINGTKSCHKSRKDKECLDIGQKKKEARVSTSAVTDLGRRRRSPGAKQGS